MLVLIIQQPTGPEKFMMARTHNLLVPGDLATDLSVSNLYERVLSSL